MKFELDHNSTIFNIEIVECRDQSYDDYTIYEYIINIDYFSKYVNQSIIYTRGISFNTIDWAPSDQYMLPTKEIDNILNRYINLQAFS